SPLSRARVHLGCGEKRIDTDGYQERTVVRLRRGWVLGLDRSLQHGAQNRAVFRRGSIENPRPWSDQTYIQRLPRRSDLGGNLQVHQNVSRASRVSTRLGQSIRF